MLSIQKVCSKIGDKLAYELKLEKDQQAVIQYGLFALIHTTLSILIVILFGTLFNVLIEALLISFTGAILRKYSGGAHAKSPIACTCIGTIVTIGAALVITHIIWPATVVILLGVLTFILAYYLVVQLAPVDSLAKPIRKQEKRNTLKQKSIMTLSIYLIGIIITLSTAIYYKNNDLLTGIVCMYIGIGWQVFTLTSLGHRGLKQIEQVSIKIISKILGGKENEKNQY